MYNNEDDDWLKRYRNTFILSSQEELNSVHKMVEEFKSYAKGFGLELDTSNIEFVSTIGVVAKHPNILGILDPQIHRDKEGLVACSDLYNRYRKISVNPGYLAGDNYMVMLNKVFRRGMRSYNNWAPRFVDEFWKIDEPETDAYISLDFNRVRVNVDNRRYIEMDTWYGAPFQEKIRSIPDGSVYLRPPQDLRHTDIMFMFAATYSLEVFWSTKEQLRTFQALEFKTDDVSREKNGKDMHPAKYLHAVYNINSEQFEHFDAAVQYYSDEEYFLRRDRNFRQNVGQGNRVKAISEKAFKLNGHVATDLWVKLTSHYLSGDPLVLEYFTGTLPAHVIKALNRMRQQRDILT
ncbi:MAG: hypothetical protein ACTSYJ_12600 [Candidatus Thorarchaeota archaeon]